jgi:hypothetical protein
MSFAFRPLLAVAALALATPAFAQVGATTGSTTTVTPPAAVTPMTKSPAPAVTGGIKADTSVKTGTVAKADTTAKTDGAAKAKSSAAESKGTTAKKVSTNTHRHVKAAKVG